MEKKNITIVGLGYVGTSLSVMLSKKNNVKVIDIDTKKLELLNNNQSPIIEPLIDSYLEQGNRFIQTTTNKEFAYKDADYVIIATPTNYDESTNKFDTSSIESVIEDILKINKKCLIVIKSTIPIGFTNSLREKHNTSNIIFSPEFLREGSALYDNLNPSRIVVGSNSVKAKEFSEILLSSAEKTNIKVLHTTSSEAESIKLFANSYLALRVSFFNELDAFCYENNLSSANVIKGISLDARIGDYYNNPSFGYGGYCLPKDTKQLLSNFEDIPQNIFSAIVESNNTRTKFLTESILSMKASSIGFYRLQMKSGSDNTRSNSSFSLLESISKYTKNIFIYEPLVNDKLDFGFLINDLEEFKDKSDLIVANRYDEALNDVKSKVFTRDIFYKD